MSEVREKFTLEKYVFTDIWEAHEYRRVKNSLTLDKRKSSTTLIFC